MIDERKLIEAITDVEVAWYLDGNYTTYDSTTIMDIIEEQPKVGEWISCSERLPKQGEQIIGTFDNGNGRVIVCQEQFFLQILEKPYPLIAWMPLPEPYKEE